MKINTNYQKGSVNTALIALVILIIFLIAGTSIFYRYRKDDEDALNNPALSGTNTNSYSDENKVVVATTSVTTLKTIYKPARTVVRTSPGTPFPGGQTYQSSIYGLTVFLPATYNKYTVTVGKDSYTGVSDTASLHFAGINGHDFTINVFTMEQWNKIRTIENVANMNVNSYGEGDYLGENFKYIYSSYGPEPELQKILDQVRFY